MNKSRFGIRPLDINERIRIHELSRKDLSCGQISKLIGRSKNCVVHEIRTNGGREIYDPHESQKRADEIKKSQIKALRNSQEGLPKNLKFKERIENLEMQVAILHETIKELMKK